MTRVRDLNRTALEAFVSPLLRVNWESWSILENRVWQFIIFLPRWLLTNGNPEPVCTAEDQDCLEDLLERHCGLYRETLFLAG